MTNFLQISKAGELFQPEPLTKEQNHELTFAFDNQSYGILQKMKQTCNFRSDADLIRQALRIMRTLQELAKKGYSEVIVQHEESGEQKLLVIKVCEFRSKKPVKR